MADASDTGSFVLGGTVRSTLESPATPGTVQVTAGLFVVPRTADGGCGDGISAGPQQVTVSTAALPYVYSFTFPAIPAVCSASADVTANEYSATSAVLASGASSCAVSSEPGDYCSAVMNAVPPPPMDAGPDAAALLGSTITISGIASGPGYPGSSAGIVKLYLATVPVIEDLGMTSCLADEFPAYQFSGTAAAIDPSASSTPWSFTVGPFPDECTVGFAVEGEWDDQDGQPLSGGTLVYCGTIGQAGSITSTNVTCNASF
jgi:hypothetical protein